MDSDERPEQAGPEPPGLEQADAVGDPWLLPLLPHAGEPEPDLGDEVGVGSDWAVPWSDLMMTMFILFVVLFVYQAAEREMTTGLSAEPLRQAPSEQPPDLPDLLGDPVPPEALFEQSLAAARDLGDVEVSLQQDGAIRVSMRGSVFFDLGSADLGPEAQDFLDRLSDVLVRTDRGVHVIGHTDTFPIHSARYPTNWELSAARAAAVARHLIRAGAGDPARFTVTGRAMYEPAVPNTSLKNKALNRRVDLLIGRPADGASG